MKKTSQILVVVACAVVLSVVSCSYGLFHGYFDHGRFEIKQVQWSPSKQVAMIAERSDQEAMSSYTYFVLIGSHVFSPDELRHAYHSNAPVFAAASSCLDLHWEGPSRLVVVCKGSTVDLNHIDVQKRESGRIAISYENIALK